MADMREFLVSVRPVDDGFVATCQPVKPSLITGLCGEKMWRETDLPTVEGRASTFNGAMVAAMSQLLIGRV